MKFVFYHLGQETDENIAQWGIVLHALINECKFCVYIDEVLRDQLMQKANIMQSPEGPYLNLTSLCKKYWFKQTFPRPILITLPS